MPDEYLQPMGGQGGAGEYGGNEMEQTREAAHADASQDTVPEDWRIQYNPDTDYQYTPTAITDPWYNPSFIQPGYTDGGEFYFTRRDVGGVPYVPKTVAQTYVGHYFQWIKAPTYGDPELKKKYGQRGDFVRGQFYYGINQKGKPPISGEKYNAILAVVPDNGAFGVGGPVFLENDNQGLLTAEAVDEMSTQGISELEQAGAHPRQLVRASAEQSNRLVIDRSSDKKYLHIPLGITAEKTANKLRSAGNSFGARITLGFPRNDNGYMGSGPTIHNQPNMHTNLTGQETIDDID